MNKVLLLAFTFFNFNLFAQTTLNKGDIAIVAYSTVDDAFAFATFVDLEIGTEIYFTDEEADNDFTIATNEGHILFTAANAVSAGTVLSFTGTGGVWTNAGGSFAPGNNGDGLIAYQGSSVGNVTTFLHAVGEDAGDVGTFPANTLSSNDFLLFGADDGNYTGITSGTPSELFAAINTLSNWATGGSLSLNPPASFTISTGPSVGFNNSTSSENEIDATFNVSIPVTLSNYGGSQVDLSVTVNGGSAEAGDYTLNTTSLSFTADGTQNVSLDINDDADFDDETLELLLTETSATGIVISTATHTITIIDNDIAPPAPQAVDNFTDGDFTSSPEWTGDVGSYSIVTNSTLPGGTNTDGNYLGSNSNVGTSALVTSSTNTSEWKFSLGSGSYSPSSSNNFGVILMSDVSLSGDITATTWNGYYILLGVNGSTDRIELWRRSNNSSTRLGTFNTSNYGSGALQNGINIRVTRSGTGEFELFYADNTFNYTADPTISAGSFTDNNHTTSSFFGVFTDFTSLSTTRRIFIDNVNDQSVLPVELVSFTASKSDRTTLLQWTTSSEINNDYFTIQASTDGKNFKEIGQLKGAGTTEIAQEYNFVDKNPSQGLNYYRLLQVDYDGTATYSKVVTMNFRNNNDEITIFPNPTADVLTIKFPTFWKGETTISISNNLGQTVKVVDEISETLSVQDLPNGIYFLTIQNGNQTVTKRFQKQ